MRRTLTGHGLDAEQDADRGGIWVERMLATPLDEQGLQLATVTLIDASTNWSFIIR